MKVKCSECLYDCNKSFSCRLKKLLKQKRISHKKHFYENI